MQKIATKIFTYASVTFGILGIINILASGSDNEDSLIFKLLFVNVFIILSSFGVSVAGKYLNGK